MPFIVFCGDLWLSGTTYDAIIDEEVSMNGNQEQILLSVWFSETASGISNKLDRKQVLKVFSLKFVDCWPNSLMGVSLAGKICTRASAESMHELKKNTVISTNVFNCLVEVENVLLIRFNDSQI